MSHYNRLNFDSIGERALKNAHRLKFDLWRRDNGQICAEFELHGSVGDDFGDDDDGGGGAKEPADLRLLFELLERFQHEAEGSGGL